MAGRTCPERELGFDVTSDPSSPLPPFERWRITFRLDENVDFHFDHGGVLRGLLSAALQQHDLPPGLVPFACESGRVHFRAGDQYNLGLTLVGDARRLRSSLLSGLRRLGRKTSEGETPPTLAGNFRVADAERLTEPNLGETVGQLSGSDRLTLQFVSPFRLERPDHLKEPGEAYINDSCFPADLFLERLWARLFYVREGRYPKPEELPSLADGVEARPGEMMWIDVPVEAAPGKQSYTLGGVLGRVLLSGNLQPWLPTLVAGQYAQAGKSTHYGLGAYAVEEAGAPLPGFRPARSGLERVASPGRLKAAFEHIRRQSGTPGVDGVVPEDFPGGARAMRDLAGSIRDGEYSPRALRGALIPKDSGGVRGLAIPTVRDRVVQRTASQVLSPSVDTLLEDCSFAYRKGFSREGAARAIERAYRDGYRFVLDADIESFFDAVDWDVLSAKLEALFPFDPLIDLIRRWIRAPVEFRGHEIDRRTGIPQGCPISPLLANLYLDELDEEVLEEGYRLVRYADDFVVLCRSIEDAKEARRDVCGVLNELGLDLNRSKTAIRSAEDGFNFLGYVFCRSVVVEDSSEDGGGHPAPLSPDELPDRSWMAEVPFRDIRAVVSSPDGGKSGEGQRVAVEPVGTDGSSADATDDAQSAAQPVPIGSQVGLRPDGGTPVYVVTPGSEVSVNQGRLRVAVDGGDSRSLPVRELSHLVVSERTDVTMHALAELQEAGVPVFVTRHGTRVRASVEPGAPDWNVWLAQARVRSDGRRRLAFGRSVVRAKLHNQATLVSRFGWGDGGAADRIRGVERKCEDAGDIDRLLGFEGEGSRLFYQALAESLPEKWSFERRQRRPPPDPVNAMLSFAYTLLHEEVSAGLAATGLNAGVGLLHRGRRGHRALASDLVEEFRFLGEALVWTLIQRRQIKPDDFRPSEDGSYPCLLTYEAREEFLQAYHGRLNTRFTPSARRAEKQRYRDFMVRQARSLRRMIEGEEDGYQPLRLHA